MSTATASAATCQHAVCLALALRLVAKHESRADFDQIFASTVDRYKPVDQDEWFLIETLLTDLWHLRRVESAKRDLLAMAHLPANTKDIDRALDQYLAEMPSSPLVKAFRRLRGMERKCAHSARHVHRQIQLLQAARFMEGSGPAAKD
ncbi:MAG: hypothetical protein FJW20_22275 [Acidimicrobiia bacterium]|nr:hypothetical protein [Acidimicrobiia bacterium]